MQRVSDILKSKPKQIWAAPDACYMPDQLQTGKTWGVAVNLYALRSGRNWGIGDLGDLRTLVTWLSGLNAGLVGINPLHEIPNTTPFGISPYSPISRLYRNFIYIDLDAVPEIAGISVVTGHSGKDRGPQKKRTRRLPRSCRGQAGTARTGF